jgi:hypothetical protein
LGLMRVLTPTIVNNTLKVLLYEAPYEQEPLVPLDARGFLWQLFSCALASRKLLLGFCTSVEPHRTSGVLRKLQ